MCRHGKLTLVQVASKTSTNVWVIDVTTLGSLAFKTASHAGDTLQSILENSNVLKVIQDSPTFLEGGHKSQRHSYWKMYIHHAKETIMMVLCGQVFFDVRQDSDALYNQFGVRIVVVAFWVFMSCI